MLTNYISRARYTKIPKQLLTQSLSILSYTTMIFQTVLECPTLLFHFAVKKNEMCQLPREFRAGAQGRNTQGTIKERCLLV